MAELWIEFGVGKHYRFIPAHLISDSLGPEKAKALPFFHAITGCDTTSAFAGIGKRMAWDVWNAFPQITTNFSRPSCELNDSYLNKIERFVVLRLLSLKR